LLRRRPRLVLVVPLAVAFLALSFAAARFLTVEGQERDAIAELLRVQARGDAAAVAARLDACPAVCRTRLTAFVPRLKAAGTVKIARLDSGTSYSLGTDTGWSRVVWLVEPHGVPIVQCVLVRRQGSPLTGRSVSLLRLGAPLADNEGSC
jgi:hypothetical protein